MKVDRPASGETLNTGSPTTPRQAATVILLRGGEESLEVLLAKRNPAQRFMGGAWVFPGGAIDPDEDHRVAGVREVAEEVGIALPDPEALVKFARWITPEEARIRFDTHFYLAAVPEDTEAVPDGSETVDLGWFTPTGALEAGVSGEITLVFPTMKTLEQLAPFASAGELLQWAQGRRVEPVRPRIVGDGETARIVLPGEPGYEP